MVGGEGEEGKECEMTGCWERQEQRRKRRKTKQKRQLNHIEIKDIDHF